MDSASAWRENTPDARIFYVIIDMLRRYVTMKEQDMRAVESLCRCGMSLEGVIGSFPSFPKEEIEAVYNSVNKIKPDIGDGVGLSINCS